MFRGLGLGVTMGFHKIGLSFRELWDSIIKGLWGLVLGFYEGVWVSGPMKGFGLRV